MSKQQILDTQAASLDAANKIKEAQQAMIDSHAPIQGKIKAVVVAITYTVIIEPEPGFEGDYDDIIANYGFPNG